MVAPAPDGTACDDGNATTVGDMCTAGTCAGTPDVGPVCDGLACDDANVCTADACTESGCSHLPLADGTPCDDGSRKTWGDTCRSGVCAGTPKRVRGKWATSRSRWFEPERPTHKHWKKN